jgi:NADH-quinone oxidoreductase subunit L
VTATAVALLLFLGATGKSAQIPLYIWLPDAMEGPTPVSRALIHAATMVTGRRVSWWRVNPLFHVPWSYGLGPGRHGGDHRRAYRPRLPATIAVAQDDIKKVLAYSTISQLGYMFLAVGVGRL